MKKPRAILEYLRVSIFVVITLFVAIPLLIGLSKLFAGEPLLIDINTGVGDSSPGDLVDVNGTVFFRADDGVHGSELWVSDGTVLGTEMVEDIFTGSDSGYPNDFINVNGTVFFSTCDNDNLCFTESLWKSDGTEAGTVLVKDLEISSPVNVNGTLFFYADDGINGEELWKSNGTEIGTVMVKDITAGGGSSSFRKTPVALGNNLIFNVNYELWVSDGTEANTIKLTNAMSVDGDPVLYDGNVYFYGDDGGAYGAEPWKSDGTVGGTVLLKDVVPGTSGCNPGPFVTFNDHLYFWTWDDEFYKSDGTAIGTEKIHDQTYDPNWWEPMVELNGDLYFVGADSDWNYGEELWKIDGDTGVASMVKDIYPGSEDGGLEGLVVVGDKIYFSATDDLENGYNTEPWMSDGTSGGTEMLANIEPLSEEGSYPEEFTKAGDLLFFSAWTNAEGTELYSFSTAAQLSTDSTLSALGITDCTLSPVFDTGETSYTCDVSSSIGSVNITGTTSFSGATLTVDGVTAVSGIPIGVNLMPDVNDIEIIVTAEDGVTTNTYTISVSKPIIAGASYYTYDSTLDFGRDSGLQKPYISTIDDEDNFIIGGYYTGSTAIDFDPGEGTAMSPAEPRHFLLKLNSDREFVWVKFWRIISGSFNGLDTDSSGNIFVGGSYQDILDLNPATGEDVTVEAGYDRGGFLLKLDSSGNYVWGKATDFPTGEVGLWNFDETADNSCPNGGDVCDSSGIGNEGVLNGTASIVDTSNVKGRDFDGNTGTYIDIGNLSLFETQTFTVEAYIKKEGACGALDYCSIISRGSSANIGFNFGISNDKLQIRLNDLGFTGEEYLDGTTDLADDTWYYVAAVVDGENKTLALYVNNALDSSGTFTEVIRYAGPGNVKIGNGNGANDLPFNGVIDGVRFSNVVRDLAYLQANSTKYSGGDGSDVGSYTENVVEPVGEQGSQVGSNIKVDSTGNILVESNTSYYYTDFSADDNSEPRFMKFDTNGNLLWEKEFSNPEEVFFNFGSISLDSDDNPIFVGYINGPGVDFDPGAGVDVPEIFESSTALYVTKLASDGSYMWTKLIRARYQGDFFYTDALSEVDSNDNIVIYSDFSGTVEFEPGISTSSYEDTTDNFLIKLDEDGEYLWHKAFEGDSENDEPIDLAINDDNNIFVSGRSGSETLTIGSSVVDVENKSAFADTFFLELKSTGEYVFSRFLLVNSSSSVETYKILFDTEDSMYYTGFYDESIDFNSGEDSVNESVFTTPPDNNMFLAKYIKSELGEVSISGLQEGLVAIDTDTGLDVSIPSVQFAGDDRDIKIYFSEGLSQKLIADVVVDLNSTISWSDVEALFSSVEKKVLINNLHTALGVDGSFLMYIPKGSNDDSIWVCPNASQLSDISASCLGGFRVSEGLTTVSVDESDYWRIIVSSNSGILSYEYVSEEEEEEEEEEQEEEQVVPLPPVDDQEEEIVEEEIPEEPLEEEIPAEVPGGNEEEESESTEKSLMDDIENIYKEIAKIVVDTSKQVKSIFDNSPVSAETTTIVSVTALSAIAASSGGSIMLGSTYIQSYVIRIFSALFGFFRIGRKKRGYGIVYDSVTKEPLNGAIIRVYDEKNTLKTTEVSNKQGVFELYLENGTYKLDVQISNYQFPSSVIQTNTDFPYEDIYHGQRFNYQSPQDINFSIPVDSAKGKIVKSVSSGMKNILQSILNFAVDALVVVGLLASIHSYIKVPDQTNALVLAIYLVIILIRIVLSNTTKHRFGKVKDTEGRSVEGVELGLLDAEFGRIVTKRVTNGKGEYRFLVASGEYDLVSLDSGYQLEKEMHFKKKGKGVFAINKNIRLVSKNR